MAEDPIQKLAVDYVNATNALRNAVSNLKTLRERKAGLSDDLLSAMIDDEVETVMLPTGWSVRLYGAKKVEKFTADLVRDNLITFLDKHDRPTKTSIERATDAAEFIASKRNVEETSRLSIKKPRNRKKNNRIKKQ